MAQTMIPEGFAPITTVNEGDTVTYFPNSSMEQREKNAVQTVPQGFIPMSEQIAAPPTETDKINSEASYQFQRGMKESFTGSGGRIMEADWGFTPYRLSMNWGEDSWLPDIKFENGLDVIGVTEDQWDAMDGDQRRKALDKIDSVIEQRYFSKDLIKDKDKFSWWKIGGMLTDPTTAIPVLGTTAKAVAASSAAIGATDAAVWSYGQEGKVDPVAVTLGAVGGAVIGGGIAKIASKMKSGGKALADEVAQDEVISNISSGKPPLKLKDGPVERLIKNASNTNKFINDIIEPIFDRLVKINPRFGGALNKMYQKTMEQTYKNDLIISPFIKKMVTLRKNHPDVYSDLWRALANEQEDVARSIMKTVGMEKDFKVVEALLEKNYQEAIAAGRKINKIGFYFPMKVKDPEKLRELLQARVKEGKLPIGDKQAAKLAADLEGKPSAVRAQIIEDFFRGIKYPSDTKVTPGFAKQRMVRERDDEMLNFYHRPEDALIFWAREAIEDNAIRNFLGRANTQKTSWLVEDDDSLGKAIEDTLINEYGITDVTEAKDLLQVLFQGVHKAPNKAIQAAKSLTQGALLAHPTSGMTQLVDLSMTLRYQNIHAFKGILDALRLQKGSSLESAGLDAQSMGIMETMTAELLGPEGPHKTLTRLLKASGFTNIDKFGKDTFIRASLSKFKSRAKSEKGQEMLFKRWESYLGREAVQDAIDAVNSGNLNNGNLKLILFSDLANIQPITPASMPKAFWNNPNARFMYTLKSFQLKYVNQLRQHIQAGLLTGKARGSASHMSRKEALIGLAALVGFTTMLGVGVQELKDSFLGKEDKGKEWSEKIIDEAWKATGIFSRYDINKLGETDDLLGWAGELVLAPPTDPIINTGIVVKSMLSGERPPEYASRKYVQMIPLFGRELEAWGLTLPDLDYDRWGAVQKLSDVPMKTYFPPDPVGAMWGSPNAWVPGNELWNERALEKRINKPYEEVMKDADELKRQEAWWRDATR